MRGGGSRSARPLPSTITLGTSAAEAGAKFDRPPAALFGSALPSLRLDAARGNGPSGSWTHGGEWRTTALLGAFELADPPTPTLVLVSGPPGSGKTSLARALAQAIPCPAVCRDEIKEGMAHAQGGEFQGSAGGSLTRRTLPLFFDVVRLLVTSGVTVVAEAAFQDQLWRPGIEPLRELADLRIVDCNVDAGVSFERAARRAGLSQIRRTVHGDSTVGKTIADWRRSFEAFEFVNRRRDVEAEGFPCAS